MNQDILKGGSFYSIIDNPEEYILLDKTKKGLECKEQSTDKQTGIITEKGKIHDINGIGHMVPIRWHYQKDEHSIESVINHAKAIEKRYTELREITCPSD